VYYGVLDPNSPDIPKLRQLLSDDEIDRANRFHFDKNRNEYIFARGSLRVLLSTYLQIPAKDLRFSYTEHNKPYLANPMSAVISFNVSHTNGLVAFAFSRDRKIGVDVEAIRENLEVSELAERFFSEAERQVLREAPATSRYALFFRCWTRKEAYIKARGEGLSHPLAQFDVSLDEDTANALSATRPDPLEVKRWVLRPFAVPIGFAAAVAVEIDGPPSKP